MKILFITANRIGDAVLSLGLLSHMVEHYPNAQFTIACGPVAADLFRAVPRLEKLIVMKKRKKHMHWLNLWADCCCNRWDLIVDLRNSLVSRLLLSKRRACKLSDKPGIHKVEDNARILGLSPPPSPFIWTDDEAEKNADRHMPQGSHQSVLALGPAANWPAKQWSNYNFLSLARSLTSTDGPLADAKILIAAATSEYEQAVPLLEAIPENRIINLIGYDLLTVAACFKRCRLFIGNDSGLMHIAAAVGIPTLGLFGPGYENIYGPWGKNSATVRTEESTAELLSWLPYEGAFYPNLMGGLSVDKAYIAAETLLRKTSPQA
ncbi:MAG: glycosyltransferase family 9 protein [Alphaproteobacteria bacterium]|nr:glycosyltransferase family 9 protein [Alphaproteobacteria bacterium]